MSTSAHFGPTDYFTGGTRLPTYLPYPLFLLSSSLSLSARQIYALLLGRATLSQKNGWTDEAGRVFLLYPIERLAADVGRSSMTVKNALRELEQAGLLCRRRTGFNRPNRLYVKLPLGEIPTPYGKEMCPREGRKTDSWTDSFLSPNYKSKKHNYNYSISENIEDDFWDEDSL